MGGRRTARFAALVAATVWLCLPAPAHASSADVGALQVALRAERVYGGAIDGIRGPATRRAVRRFQRRKGLTVDGIAGPGTRRKLGRRGRPGLGSRAMRRGHRGWDVAALQFMLRRRGVAPGSVDGGFGSATGRAVRRFQRRAGIGVDGVAGPGTIRRLRRHRRRRLGGRGRPSGPVRFFRPVSGQLGDGFGWRWGRPHQGIDFAAPAGARVAAAGRGVVRSAGWNSGGYGYLVIVRHRLDYETWYAHLSVVTSHPGERVSGGTRIGLVGATGHATGPHLHFEARHRGTPIDPLPRLLATTASSARRRAPAAHPGCDREGLERRSRGARRPPPSSVC